MWVRAFIVNLIDVAAGNLVLVALTAALVATLCVRLPRHEALGYRRQPYFAMASARQVGPEQHARLHEPPLLAGTGAATLLSRLLRR